MVAELIVFSEPVKAVFLTVLYGTWTTTSRRYIASVASVTSMLLLEPIGTSFVTEPTDEMLRVFASAFTTRLNVPSALVEVPVLAPFTKTEASAIGSPCAFLTAPVIVRVCAKTADEQSRIMHM